jgi:exosome complex RNA-binding protein Rrp4
LQSLHNYYFDDISDTNRYNGEVGDVIVGRIKEVSGM